MKLTIINRGSMGDALQEELTYTPDTDSFLGEGVMGAVYKDSSGQYALKVARASTNANMMREEFGLLTGIANHIQRRNNYLGSPNLPVPPVALARAEDASEVLVMYLYDQKKTLAQHIEDLLEQKNYHQAEQAAIYAAIRYTYAMDGLMSLGHACTDRKLKDWMVHVHPNNQADTVVLDWNVLKPHEQTNHATEIAVFGNLWNELYTGRIAGQNLQILEDGRFGKMSLGLRLILKACIDTPEGDRFINNSSGFSDHSELRTTLEAWDKVLKGEQQHIPAFLDTFPEHFFTEVFPINRDDSLLTKAIQADLAWLKQPDLDHEKLRDQALDTLRRTFDANLRSRKDAEKHQLEGYIRDYQLGEARTYLREQRQTLFTYKRDLMLWGHLGRWQLAIELYDALQNDFNVERYITDAIRNDLLLGVCQVLHNDPTNDSQTSLEHAQSQVETLDGYLARTPHNGKLAAIQAEIHLRRKGLDLRQGKRSDVATVLGAVQATLSPLQSTDGIAKEATSPQYYDVFQIGDSDGLLGASIGQALALEQQFNHLIGEGKYHEAVAVYRYASRIIRLHPDVKKFVDSNRERIVIVRYLRDHTPLQEPFQRDWLEQARALWDKANKEDQKRIDGIVQGYIETVRLTTCTPPIAVEAFRLAYLNAEWVQTFLNRQDLISKEAKEIDEIIRELRTLPFTANQYLKEDSSHTEWAAEEIVKLLERAQAKGIDMNEVTGATPAQGWEQLIATLTEKVQEMRTIPTFVSQAKEQVNNYGNDVAQAIAQSRLAEQRVADKMTEADTVLQTTQEQVSAVLKVTQAEWGKAEQTALTKLQETFYAQESRLSQQLNTWATDRETQLVQRFQQLSQGISEKTKTIDQFDTRFEEYKKQVSEDVAQSTTQLSAVDERLRLQAAQVAELHKILVEMYRNRLTSVNDRRTTPPTGQDINALIAILRECPVSVWKSIQNEWLQALKQIETNLPDKQKSQKIDPKDKGSQTYQQAINDLEREADEKAKPQPTASPTGTPRRTKST